MTAGGKSPLDLQRFQMCLAGNFRPEMAGATCEPPRQWCAAMQDRDKAAKVKHLVKYCKEQDAVCWRESKQRGLGGRYWETASERKLRKTGGRVPAVSRRKPQQQRKTMTQR